MDGQTTGPPRRRIVWGVAVVALSAGVLACSTGRPAVYALETFATTNTCAGVAIDSLVLHGELVNGVARTWAGASASVYWPPGYVARFDPQLVVLDAGGTIRAREGDEMLATIPWHGLNVCFQSGGTVDVWELGPWPS